MVTVEYTELFRKEFAKSDKTLQLKAKKQIVKIIENPSVGKPLRYNLRGERTIYVKPYRIIYTFKNDCLYFLRFEHRGNVYG